MKKDWPNYYESYKPLPNKKDWYQAFENIKFQKPVKKGTFKVVLDITKKSIRVWLRFWLDKYGKA